MKRVDRMSRTIIIKGVDTGCHGVVYMKKVERGSRRARHEKRGQKTAEA
jgi:hypothetical protein